MKTILLWTGVMLALWVNGCAVMSQQVMDEALPPVGFPELTRNADKYLGDTVILGGYLLSVENFDGYTRLSALQAPLGGGQRPRSKDKSQGRMTLLYSGFLDAEVYARDRKITVGGRVLKPEDGDPRHYPHVRIAVRDIYLWPVEAETYDPYGPGIFHPYPWGWHHPWHHRHRHHW